MNCFYSGNWVHECTKDTSDCEQDALSCTCYFSVFHGGKQWLAFSPHCLSKYQANLYKGQFVRAACQSCRQATFMLMHGNITSKLHLFWLRWMLFHERSSIFTSSAFLQTLKFIWHWKRGRMSKKPQFYVILLVFASILFAALFFCFLFFVTWPRCITQVLTDVFLSLFLLFWLLQYKWIQHSSHAGSITHDAGWLPGSYPYVRKSCLYCPLQGSPGHWHVCE